MTPPPAAPDAAADHLAVIAVAVAYAWALDMRQWDALDDVFTPDATADLLAHLVGRDAIRARIRAALEPLDATQHMIATHDVHIDGDRATHRCYLQAQHVRYAAVGGATFMFGGRYADQLVRTPAGWRIAHRDLVRMWTTGNPAVVAPT